MAPGLFQSGSHNQIFSDKFEDGLQFIYEWTTEPALGLLQPRAMRLMAKKCASIKPHAESSWSQLCNILLAFNRLPVSSFHKSSFHIYLFSEDDVQVSCYLICVIHQKWVPLSQAEPKENRAAWCPYLLHWWRAERTIYSQMHLFPPSIVGNPESCGLLTLWIVSEMRRSESSGSVSKWQYCMWCSKIKVILVSMLTGSALHLSFRRTTKIVFFFCYWEHKRTLKPENYNLSIQTQGYFEETQCTL